MVAGFGEETRGLPLAVDDEAAGRVVWGDRDGHAVTQHHADAVTAGVAGKLGENFVSILALDAEVPALADVDHLALQLYQVVLAHLRSRLRGLIAGADQALA